MESISGLALVFLLALVVAFERSAAFSALFLSLSFAAALRASLAIAFRVFRSDFLLSLDLEVLVVSCVI